MSRTLVLGSALTLATLVSAAAPSARADDKMYDLKIDDAKVPPGAQGMARLTIAAKNGWHVNEDAPITVTLTPDAGISLPKPKLGRDDLAVKSKEAPRFDIAFTAPTEPGKKSINAQARFVMCQATSCRPVTEKLALNVEVTPAAAPAAAKSTPKKK